MSPSIADMPELLPPAKATPPVSHRIVASRVHIPTTAPAVDESALVARPMAEATGLSAQTFASNTADGFDRPMAADASRPDSGTHTPLLSLSEPFVAGDNVDGAARSPHAATEEAPLPWAVHHEPVGFPVEGGLVPVEAVQLAIARPRSAEMAVDAPLLGATDKAAAATVR